MYHIACKGKLLCVFRCAANGSSNSFALVSPFGFQDIFSHLERYAGRRVGLNLSGRPVQPGVLLHLDVNQIDFRTHFKITKCSSERISMFASVRQASLGLRYRKAVLLL